MKQLKNLIMIAMLLSLTIKGHACLLADFLATIKPDKLILSQYEADIQITLTKCSGDITQPVLLQFPTAIAHEMLEDPPQIGRYEIVNNILASVRNAYNNDDLINQIYKIPVKEYQQWYDSKMKWRLGFPDGGLATAQKIYGDHAVWRHVLLSGVLSGLAIIDPSTHHTNSQACIQGKFLATIQPMSLKN
jgi:hypothetical protein